jgi:hypothetical protein
VEFFDIRFGVVTVKVVDNGGTVTNSDTDLFATALGPGCITENPDLPPFVPFHGFMEAFDAPPPAPTSKDSAGTAAGRRSARCSRPKGSAWRSSSAGPSRTSSRAGSYSPRTLMISRLARRPSNSQ